MVKSAEKRVGGMDEEESKGDDDKIEWKMGQENLPGHGMSVHGVPAHGVPAHGVIEKDAWELDGENVA